MYSPDTGMACAVTLPTAEPPPSESSDAATPAMAAQRFTRSTLLPQRGFVEPGAQFENMGRVIAPSLAELTCAAYLANTPVR